MGPIARGALENLWMALGRWEGLEVRFFVYGARSKWEALVEKLSLLVRRAVDSRARGGFGGGGGWGGG